MLKTLAPFTPPAFPNKKTNGGRAGLKAMRRAMADFQRLPQDKRPDKTIRIKGKFANGPLTWLQHRTLEVFPLYA